MSDAATTEAAPAAPTEAGKTPPAAYSMAFLPHNVLAVHEAATDTKARFALNGVRVSLPRHDNGDTYLVEATNGRCMVRIEGPCKLPSDPEFPHHEAAAATDDQRGEAIIPAKEFADAIRSAGKGNRLAVKMREKVTHMTYVNGKRYGGGVQTTTVEAVEGRFPAIDRVLADCHAAPVAARVAFDPAEMIRVCKAALAVSATGKGDTGRVEMVIPAGGGPFVLTASNMDGQKMTGLVMPIATK